MSDEIVNIPSGVKIVQVPAQVPSVGGIVHFVDETPGDYNDHVPLPALVQHVYAVGAEKGRVHLHVFEADPRDNNAVDAEYSDTKEPGTWHWPERV